MNGKQYEAEIDKVMEKMKSGLTLEELEIFEKIPPDEIAKMRSYVALNLVSKKLERSIDMFRVKS